jgi:hypothetical protein
MADRPKLTAVDGGQLRTGEKVVQMAMIPPKPDATMTQIVGFAEELAAETVRAIREEENPAILASVTLTISDRAVKVAFLEEVGATLL